MSLGRFYKLIIDHLLAEQGSQLFCFDLGMGLWGGEEISHAPSERHQGSNYQ